jgi:endonuclease/exonuclease/phosphatase family metal-dependent hydrolase
MKKGLVHLSFIFFFITTGCGRSKDDTLKVISLNIRYDNTFDTLNPWNQRAVQICNFIKERKPDIFGLLEALYNQYNLLDSVLQEFSSVGVGREDGAKTGEMNPVFFRKDKFDLVRTITFWLSETPDVPGSKDWGASLPRIVTWAELVNKDDHQHFFVFNTHFADDSDSARINSSEILLDQVPAITEGFPFVITGDFNMLPDSREYTVLTGPDDGVPLFKDAFYISEKKPEGPSYTFNGFSDEPGEGRIDYIFVRNGMKVDAHRIYAPNRNKEFLSDHWPVEAVIELGDKE